jgi:hypothetical protein
MASADLQQIQRAIKIFFVRGQVVEIRVPGKYGSISGYFDDHEKLATAVKRLSDGGEHDAVYYTLNPCQSALLARRAKNILHHDVRDTTSDSEIARRSWLLIDFDPKRPKGISATKEERLATLEVMTNVLKGLKEMGWPWPVIASSGNGYHSLFRVDEPNDSETAELFKNCLRAIAEKFATAAVDIDTKVFNASRITKAYGSLAAKGVNTSERPHRFSRLEWVPKSIRVVSRKQLEALARTKQSTAKAGGASEMAAKVEEFLEWGNIVFEPAAESSDGGLKWIIQQCPFNPEHKKPAVFLAPTGKLGFKCLHNSCGENHWEQFRSAVEESRGGQFHFSNGKLRTGNSNGGAREQPGPDGKPQQRPLVEVREEIEELLYAHRKNGSGLPPKDQAPSLVTDLIWHDLNTRGKFFRDSARDLAYLSLRNKEPGTDVPTVLEISDNHWFAAMLDQFYGIQIADPVTRRVIAQLENRTVTAKGPKYQVHELGQYDRTKNELFVCLGDNVIVIHPDSIKVVPNGHDDHFFVPNERYTPVDAQAVVEATAQLKKWTAGLDVDQQTPLTNYLFENVPFEKEGALTPQQAQQVIFAGFLTLPFGDAIGEKPIFYFIGDEDSGKTHLIRKMGYVLYGTGWDVVSMGEEQRDFQTSLVRNYLLGVDDVEEDTRDAKANAKKLCRCATGGYVSFRVMRSDAIEKKLPFTAWVWISGLSLFNHAPDFLSRLITISFRGELPAERQGRAELQQFVVKNRVMLLAEYVKRLQIVLLGIMKDGGSAHGIRFRMADWAKIVGPAARNEGLLLDFIDLFDAIKGERIMDAESDPLMKVIRGLFADKPQLNGQEMRIDVLEAELKAACERHAFKVHCLTDPHTASTWALSRALTKLAKVLLRKKYGFKDRKYRPHGETHKVRHVTFNITDQVMEDIRHWALQYAAATKDWRWKEASME